MLMGLWPREGDMGYFPVQLDAFEARVVDVVTKKFAHVGSCAALQTHSV